MAALELHTNSSGKGPPLVILHGLFGSWENWASRIAVLESEYQVHAMDLRNHGSSPHAAEQDYALMSGDLGKTLDKLGLQSCRLLGHSMGGKVAMQFASEFPERIDKLVVVDIAPKHYSPHHDHLIEAMQAIPLEHIKSRGEADRQFSEAEPDPVLRAFLLKNLVREDKGYRWQINLEGIAENYPNLLLAPTFQHVCESPTLFIKGADSDYLMAQDSDLVQKWFPNTTLKIIDGAGHWPHATKATVFDHILRRFLV